MKFLGAITSYVNIGFSTSTKNGQTAHNIAVSRMLLTGIKGTYPGYELDYPNIQVSDGTLRSPDNIQARLLGNDIILTWDVPHGEPVMRSWDQVMAICCDGADRAYILYNGARVTVGSETLPVQANYRKRPYHVYVSFISNDRKLISKSVYAGMIE